MSIEGICDTVSVKRRDCRLQTGGKMQTEVII